MVSLFALYLREKKQIKDAIPVKVKLTPVPIFCLFGAQTFFSLFPSSLERLANLKSNI